MYLLANRNLVGLGYGRTKITKSKKITLFLSYCVLYVIVIKCNGFYAKAKYAV